MFDCNQNYIFNIQFHFKKKFLFVNIFFQIVILYQVFLSNTNNLHTIVYFKVFLFNTNNYLVLSNYFYSIIIICLHTVIWFQVATYNNITDIRIMVKVFANSSGDSGFNPRSSHTKDFKNGT